MQLNFLQNSIIYVMKEKELIDKTNEAIAELVYDKYEL